MLGVLVIFKIYYVVLPLFVPITFAVPLKFVNFTDSNFPRQFAIGQPSAPSSGETTDPTAIFNPRPPPFLNNNGNGGSNSFPYPQRTHDNNIDHNSTTTTDYSTSTTTTDFSTTTEDYNRFSSDYDSSASDEDTTLTPFVNSDLPGFPINPPTFPILPTAAGQKPKPSISSTLLSNYPQQHVDGAVGPFPEKIQEYPPQDLGGGLTGIGGAVGATVNLLQRLNPLLLLQPVTDTFQNIGHVLSHPNYGPGSAILRPIQFWNAVNAAGNPSLTPFRKLPSNVVVISNSRKIKN